MRLRSLAKLGIDFGQITLSVPGAHEQIALGNNRIVVVNAAGQIHQSDFLFRAWPPGP
jgi:hypothetical protein